MKKISFASDNTAICHPQVLRDLSLYNEEAMPSYGDDELTHQVEDKFRQLFGPGTESFLVWNGTAANTLTLGHLCRPYEAVVASDCSHLAQDECGSLERFAGLKILTVPQEQGKIKLSALKNILAQAHYPHQVRPKVLTLTQSTEWGTLYHPQELKEICHWAHQQGWWVHLDGARLSNAAVSLGLSLKECTRDLGVDVISFGGTKNGLIGAEAVLFFDHELAQDFAFTRKQGMHLASKMRFLSAQFLSYFKNDLWKENATHANLMAKKMEKALGAFSQLSLSAPVEANALFVKMPASLAQFLQDSFAFHAWDEEKHIYRVMCAFNTTEKQVDLFTEKIAQFFSR